MELVEEAARCINGPSSSYKASDGEPRAMVRATSTTTRTHLGRLKCQDILDIGEIQGKKSSALLSPTRSCLNCGNPGEILGQRDRTG